MGNSADNRTLMLPPDEFNPLGGHTIWQVTVVTTVLLLTMILLDLF